MNIEVRKDLITKGKIRLSIIKKDRENAIHELSNKLNDFEKRYMESGLNEKKNCTNNWCYRTRWILSIRIFDQKISLYTE